jgi:hypothetical protein
MPPHIIMQGIPFCMHDIIVCMRSFMESIIAGSIGIILQTMPSLVISMVHLHIIGIMPMPIIGIMPIIGMPMPMFIIMGFIIIIGFIIIGFIIMLGIPMPIMGFIIPFIPFIIGIGIDIGIPPLLIGIGIAFIMLTAILCGAPIGASERPVAGSLRRIFLRRCGGLSRSSEICPFA